MSEKIYKGKKYFYPKKQVYDWTQLYTRLSYKEVNILNNFIKNHYPHNKAVWIREAILNKLKEDLNKLK